MSASMLFCPICERTFVKQPTVSAEAALVHHAITEHTAVESRRAVFACSGCSGDYTEQPKPFLALILQDEGPARWTEVNYCTDCVATILTGDGPDVVELIPRAPIFAAEH